jgi:hypothetical protein
MVAFASVGYAEESAMNMDAMESLFKMVLDFITVQYPKSAAIIGSFASLLVFGRVYVAMTPSKEDDKFLQRLEKKPFIGIFFRVLAAFSPIQRKK